MGSSEIQEQIGSLHRFATGLAGNPTDAEDLVQECLRRVLDQSAGQRRVDQERQSVPFSDAAQRTYRSMPAERELERGAARGRRRDAGELERPGEPGAAAALRRHRQRPGPPAQQPARDRASGLP